jgi:Integrase zinc binding domain
VEYPVGPVVNGVSDEAASNVRREQLADEVIGFILRCREQSEDQPDWSCVANRFDEVRTYRAQWTSLTIRNGILYRRFYAGDGSTKYLQLIVPASMREDFVRQAHCGITGGHFGIRRTADQVLRRDYWCGWRRYVENFCRQCSVCNQVHRRQTLDLVVDTPFTDVPADRNRDADELVDRLREAFRRVNDHTGAQAERMKRSYDPNVRSAKFEVGQLVGYYYPRRCQGRSPKWSRFYTGPFRIEKALNDVNFIIKKTPKTKGIVVHIDKLRAYCRATPACWTSSVLDHCSSDSTSSLHAGGLIDCKYMLLKMYHLSRAFFIVVVRQLNLSHSVRPSSRLP